MAAGVDAPKPQTQNSMRAKRFALQFNPIPTFFLEYEDMEGKRRVRAVKLVSVTADTDVERLTRKVIRSFPRRLDATSVKHEQVRKLVFKLVEHVRGQQQGDSKLQIPDAPSLSPSISPKLPSHPHVSRLADEAQQAMNLMRHSSESRFSTSTCSLPEEGHAPGFGELDEMLTDLDKELGLASAPASQPVGGFSVHNGQGIPQQTPTQETGHRLSRFGQESDQLVLVPDLPEDLNKVTEHELHLAKMQMEEDFRRNQLKPGDPDYQYDKQVEFHPPTQSCDWDDDDEGDF